MSTIDTGGSAFPAGPFGDTMHGEDGRVWHQYPATEGMTLRDWFAGHALAGMLSCPGRPDGDDNKASWAYALADAMIAAKKGNQ